MQQNVNFQYHEARRALRGFASSGAKEVEGARGGVYRYAGGFTPRHPFNLLAPYPAKAAVVTELSALHTQESVTAQTFFQSKSFLIPSEVKVEIVQLVQLPSAGAINGASRGSEEARTGRRGEGAFSSSRTHTFLKCTGPLGSIQFNLDKIDKYGFCFLQIQKAVLKDDDSIKPLQSSNLDILHLSIKNFLPRTGVSNGAEGRRRGDVGGSDKGRGARGPIHPLSDSQTPFTGPARGLGAKGRGAVGELKAPGTPEGGLRPIQGVSPLSPPPAAPRCAELSALHVTPLCTPALRVLNLLSSLCQQSLEGVQKGHILYLELHGVGFRAIINNDPMSTQDSSLKRIEFKLGQSHDLFYEIPKHVHIFAVKPTLIGLYGIDREAVTQIAAEIRHFKLPDSYKGKGIRYKDEIIKTKIGKKK